MSHSEDPQIKNVSDTAFWVAYYRARESERANPLFRDDLAKLLVGDRGKRIAEDMKQQSSHTEYNVLIRTVVIDRYISRLVSEGVDAVVNLGAGLDTRPYRLSLPSTLHWIEVDYPDMIAFKDSALTDKKPHCHLRRRNADLTDLSVRRKLFAELGQEFKRCVILTEGVLPYLTPEQVSELAQDLHDQPSFTYWIADYIAPFVYKYLHSPKRAAKMKNAPFLFMPPDWLGFFESRGWHPARIEYLPQEGYKLGRQAPAPWFMKLVVPFLKDETKRQFLRSSGYMIMERK